MAEAVGFIFERLSKKKTKDVTMRVTGRFSPEHRRAVGMMYYLDIDVEGLEDRGITHIGR